MSTTLDIIGGIPVISAIGTPRTTGDAIGQRLKPRIQVMAQYFKEQLATAVGDDDPNRASELLSTRLRNLVVPLARSDPSAWMEIESMAAATGMPEEDLLLIHGWGDLLGLHGTALPPIPSSYVTLPGNLTCTGLPWAIYAWHLDPALFPYVTIIRRMPSHGPANISLTLAGLHPIAGMSEAGITVASNDMRINDGGEGEFTAHLVGAALGSPAFDDALARIQRSPRQGGAALHVLGNGGRRASVEGSGQSTVILRDPIPSSPRVHTNHALDPSIRSAAARCEDMRSRDRLAHLATRSLANKALTTTAVANWFGMAVPSSESSENFDSKPLPGLFPDTTVLMILEPDTRTVHLKRGGTPARMESISL